MRNKRVALMASSRHDREASPVWSCGTAAPRGRSAAAPRSGPREPTGRSAKPPVLQQPVVQHQSPGHRQVQRESGRNSDDVVAPLQQCGRQPGALRPQNIGGIQRVAEGRQIDRVLQQLDADQGAAARQRQVGHGWITPHRHMQGRVGGVRGAGRARIPAGADGEAERRAECVPGAQQRADVGGFGDTLGADAEIAAEPWLQPSAAVYSAA